MDLIKIMTRRNLEIIFRLLSTWWREEKVPPELVEAIVASLYKKGDPTQQENNRPISLLNSIYKIYAGVVKMRFQKGMGKKLSKTQYGFRKA